MRQFKVGDEVKAIEWGWGVAKRNVGKTTTIIKLGKECDEVGESFVYVKDWGKLDIREKSFELVKRGKSPKPTHIIVYDKTSRDPIILCYGKKDLSTQLKTVVEDDNTIKDSITIYTISKVQKAETNIKFVEVN